MGDNHDEEGVYCNALAPEDFKAIAEESGLEVVKIIGKPMICQYLSGEQRKAIFKDPRKLEKLLDLELALCERPSLVGAESHLQLIAEKGATL